MKYKLGLLHILDILTQRIALPVAIISFIGVVILLVNVPWCFSCCTQPEFWATLISATVAISNALLLYSTLSSQNTSFERERFENTFYKMLDVHQRLANQIYLNQGNNNSNVICGKIFFDFFSHEMKAIKDSLSSNHYLGSYNQDKADKDFMAIDNQYENKLSSNDMDAELWKKKMEDNTKKVHTIQSTNTRYSITKTEWDKYKEATINDEIAYPFFYNKWYSIYEHYIRSVIHVLSYINKNTYVEKDIYLDYFRAMLSFNEQKMIKYHSKMDQTLGTLLRDINEDTK